MSVSNNDFIKMCRLIQRLSTKNKVLHIEKLINKRKGELNDMS